MTGKMDAKIPPASLTCNGRITKHAKGRLSKAMHD